jgi:hypothetical protein
MSYLYILWSFVYNYGALCLFVAFIGSILLAIAWVIVQYIADEIKEHGLVKCLLYVVFAVVGSAVSLWLVFQIVDATIPPDVIANAKYWGFFPPSK